MYLLVPHVFSLSCLFSTQTPQDSTACSISYLQLSCSCEPLWSVGTMFSSINLTATITRHVVATSSRKNYSYEWRNILSSSLVHKRSFQAASATINNGLFKTYHPLHLLYCSDVAARRRMFTSSCMLLDSRRTRKDGNDTKDTESHVTKQRNDEITNTTATSALNQRAAGAILTQLTSIPNILTLSRIVATPYLSYLLITHHHTKKASNDVVAAGINDTSSATTTAAETIVTNMDPSSVPLYALSLFLLMGATDFLDGFLQGSSHRRRLF